MNLDKKSIIAIMGPSGAGKTTLGERLSTRNEIAIPKHCTTRLPRNDDIEGFYRYLKHSDYKQLYEQRKFLISSGDGSVIEKEYGNFYGVLYNDCIQAWENSDVLVLFTSYKDIERLQDLKRQGMDIDIVNLTFQNLEEGILNRLLNSDVRNHTQKDIEHRVRSAVSDNDKYSEALRMYAKTIVYTDVLDIEETYNKVCGDLDIGR